MFAPPPLDHKVLEVIPCSLFILFITSIHHSVNIQEFVEVTHPLPLCFALEGTLLGEGMGVAETGTYGMAQLGMGCPFIQKKSDCPVPLVTLTGHLTIQQPLLL